MGQSPKYPLSMLLLAVSFVANAAQSTLIPLDPRPRAPAFTLTDTKGNTISLDDFRGQILVVNFWATWCPPCLEEMPSIERGAQWLAKYNGHFVAINFGEQPEAVAEFLKDLPLGIRVLLDSTGTVAAAWGVNRLPVTFVIDPEGRIAYLALGARDWSQPALLVPIRALGLDRN